MGWDGKCREGIVICFSNIAGNHDLRIADTLPSVCAALTKATVHCICTCDTQLWHFVFVILLPTD